MVLSDVSITTECALRGMIEPFYAHKMTDLVSGLSYGLQPCSYDFRCAEKISLAPRQHMLASTIEKISIPNNICASLMDKSSWARRFLSVGNTHFDPGFRGTPTVELTNHSNELIVIERGTPICQFRFFWLDRPARIPYDGKYQDQVEGPQPWRKDS